MIFKLRLILVSPLFLVLACGCGSSSSAPASVHGKVTYHGQPVTGGTVRFIGSGTYPCNIDKDGNYSGRDLPAGELVVTVETESEKPRPSGGTKSQYSAPEGQRRDQTAEMRKAMQSKFGGQAPSQGTTSEAKGAYVPIPKKYADPNTSPLRKTLSKGDQKYDIELTD